MKDYLEKAKDILYDFSDYIIIGGIILSIVLIIGWRLDILFPQTVAIVNEEDTVKVEKEVNQEIEETKDKTIEVIDKDNKTSKSDSKKDSEKVPENVEISIPKGTHSTAIGSILVDHGLIKSTKDFEDKVDELDLEKKLRSGEFDIEKDASLETIVKIIANQK